MNPRSPHAARSAFTALIALVVIVGLLITLRAVGPLPSGAPFTEAASHASPTEPALVGTHPSDPNPAPPGTTPIPDSPNRPETAPTDVADKRREEGREYNNPGGVEAFHKLIELYKQPYSGTVTLRARSEEGAALVTLRSPSLPQMEPGDYGIKQFAIPGGYTWEETISVQTMGQTVWQMEVTSLERGILDRFSCATLLEGHPDQPYTTAEGPSAYCSVVGKTPDELTNEAEKEAQS